MKVPGLGSGSAELETPRWYLLRAGLPQFCDPETRHWRLETPFTVASGPSAGAQFVEQFYLTQKAKSRLRCFLSRAGYPKELLEKDEVDEAKVEGLTVWALVISDERYGALKIDGWNFRAPDDPPEETQEVDYQQADSAEIAAEALDV